MNLIALLPCALLAIVAALLAFTRRSLVHGGLMLVVAWMGLAGLYFVLGAEFLALAQMLVYVGAVSMVVLFAVVMTRPQHEQASEVGASDWKRIAAAVACVAPVLGFIVAAARQAPFASQKESVHLTVREIGLELMGRFATPLLIIGVLLTSALIGAVLLAAPDEKEGNS